MGRLSRLSTRFVLAALLAVGPGLAIVVYEQTVDRQMAHDHAVENVVRLAQLAADQQAAVFSGVQRLLAAPARFPGVLAEDPTQRIAPISGG